MTEERLALTTCFGEQQRVDGRFLADAQLDLFGRHGIATSVLLRGADGFPENTPLVSVAVDTRPRIEALVDELRSVQRTGLITLERTLRDVPDAAKLTVFVGRGQRVGRTPAFVAVCDLLHRAGLAAATVLLGVDGTAHGQRQRARFFSRNADVPMMVVAVGPGDAVARVLPELDALPMVTLEQVTVCKRDGELIARPPTSPDVDDHGRPLRQKLMIFTSEAALHDGRPVHREIVQRLRRTGARGATALRGVWGFAGDHVPHGDRLLQLGRRVPVLTVVIDSPDRIAASFDVVDELTAEHGVVSSEMVPALAGADRDADLGLADRSY